jgi:amino acid transporter/mannitol/fructose-specific phosphotransferase system IIA component (Ntr-type)
LPGLAFARAGPSVVLSYLIAGILAAAGMLCIAELTTAMPRAGGDYFFVTRGLGPAVGTIAGLLSWVALSLKSSFALVGMAALTAMVVPVDVRLLAFLFCLLFLAINVVGANLAGRIQAGLVVGLLVLMALYVVLGLRAVDVNRFEPLMPARLDTLFATAGFVFISYGGLLKVASVAEEVTKPERNVPLGMVLSLLVVLLSYVLVVLVTVGVLDAGRLRESLAPMSDGARAFSGPWGAVVMSVAAVIAFVSTANAGIMAASRYLLALSRDQLLPGFLGRVNERYRTPHTALLVTAGAAAVSLMLKLDVLIKAASTVLILTYLLAVVSVVVMRESRVQNYQPKFRAPLYPWLQIASFVGFVLLLFEMGLAALLVSCGLAIAGFLAYWLYGRARTLQEYALLHLVERLTAREFAGRSLEEELREVIRERDAIVADRFDEMVERCVVLDIGERLELAEFLVRAGAALAPRLGLPAAEIARLLAEREHETTTVLTPHLAIPHLVIPGEHHLDVLIARGRQGVRFSESSSDVRMVFIIAGTRDERNFHLRVLAAVAQVVQDPGFERHWLASRNAESLRDLILLGKRRRGAAV